MGSREVVLTCTHNQCFEQKYEKKNPLKMNIFTAVKYCCILHGRVYVMSNLLFLVQRIHCVCYFIMTLPVPFM